MVERAELRAWGSLCPCLGVGQLARRLGTQRLLGWGTHARVSVLAVQALALSAAIRMRPFAPFSFTGKLRKGARMTLQKFGK